MATLLSELIHTYNIMEEIKTKIAELEAVETRTPEQETELASLKAQLEASA